MSEEATPLLSNGSVQREGTSEQYDDDFLVTSKPKGLSLFAGVFVPCTLSIFSVVLFLRLGFIIGQTGVYLTLAMLFVSECVVTLTICSIAAISTNGVVKGGGAYYMISRSLGPEFGGSIGILFFFANVFSSGLYVTGFTESLDVSVPGIDSKLWFNFAYSSAVLFFCLIVCLAGAGVFAKAQMYIFTAVIFSVITVVLNFAYAKVGTIPWPSDNPNYCYFNTELQNCNKSSANDTKNEQLHYTGFNETTFSGNLYPKYSVDYTQATSTSPGVLQNMVLVFAVLFNGCTGIMAGANISGDLKDASHAIP